MCFSLCAVCVERCSGAGVRADSHLHPQLLHSHGPGWLWLLHDAGLCPACSLPLDHLQGVGPNGRLSPKFHPFFYSNFPPIMLSNSPIKETFSLYKNMIKNGKISFCYCHISESNLLMKILAVVSQKTRKHTYD